MRIMTLVKHEDLAGYLWEAGEEIVKPLMVADTGVILVRESDTL